MESNCADIKYLHVQANDAVVALHPNYSFSYAPGAVLDVSSDLWMTIRFYDGQEAHLPRDEVYRLPTEKFEFDVAYILKCEEQWVGQAVVARNDKTAMFQLGQYSHPALTC